MSKNGHFANRNPPVSYFRIKIVHVPKRRKNGHFANGKPPISSAARISFLRLRNVQKWSLHERDPDRFLFREEIFTQLKVVISGTVSRPFRRRPEYAFPGSETSNNVHFASLDALPKKSPYNPLYQLFPKHTCDFYLGYHGQNISGQGKIYENRYMYSKPSSFSGTTLLKNP